MEASSLSSQATVATKVVEIRPQAGPQERVLSCPADILISGGCAGGGKTWGLMAEPMRHLKVKGFSCVIFRRSYPEIMNKGGLWDEGLRMYPKAGGVPRVSDTEFVFREPEWSKEDVVSIKFAHLQHDKDCDNYTGAQIPLIEFDQLELFEERMFWYMFSRNRSLCGITPYIRATCNPVPADDKVGGWLHRLIQWWIDERTGDPIPERDGKIRYMVRSGEELIWGDTKEEIIKKYPQYDPIDVKSITFIRSTLDDNKILMKNDPGYKGRLMLMPRVERERLLSGNWNVRPTAGNVFNRAWFILIEVLPNDIIQITRYWDKAGTDGGGDWSAGVKIGYSPSLDKFVVMDAVRGQWDAFARENVIKQTAQLDGPNVATWIEQEPGSGGKESAMRTIKMLAGFNAAADKVTGNKYLRAQPFAAQVQAGNVVVLIGPWTEAYLSELHAYDPNIDGVDDQVDGSSGAFNKVALNHGLKLMNTNPTEAQVEIIKQRDQEILEQRVREAGCVFPGEW